MSTLKQKARKAVEMAQDERKGELISVYSLRGLNPVERFKTALNAINEERPDFVFLDGLADLCADFNDQKECKQVVDELANVAEMMKCAVLAVIHTNKTDKSEARGHVGAIAQQKAGEVYEVKRETGCNVADVTQALSRFAGVPDMAFEFGDGFALLPAYGGMTKLQCAKREQQEKLLAAFGELLAGEKSMSYTELAKKLAELMKKGKRWAENQIKEAKHSGILTTTQKGRQQLYKLAAGAAFSGVICDNYEEEK